MSNPEPPPDDIDRELAPAELYIMCLIRIEHTYVDFHGAGEKTAGKYLAIWPVVETSTGKPMELKREARLCSLN